MRSTRRPSRNGSSVVPVVLDKTGKGRTHHAHAL